MTADGARPDAPVTPSSTSIYRPSTINILPRWIYFNYCTGDDTNAKVTPYVFKRSDPVGDIQQEFENIVRRIKGSRPPEPISSPVPWTRMSVLMIALEGPDKLKRGAAFEIAYVADRTNPQPNHSFFDGDDLDEYDNVTAAYVVNHMVRRGGGAIPPGQSEPFHWWTYHTEGAAGTRTRTAGPAAAAPRKLGNFYMFFHDDSGNNVGPTTPP